MGAAGSAVGSKAPPVDEDWETGSETEIHPYSLGVLVNLRPRVVGGELTGWIWTNSKFQVYYVAQSATPTTIILAVADERLSLTVL